MKKQPLAAILNEVKPVRTGDNPNLSFDDSKVRLILHVVDPPAHLGRQVIANAVSLEAFAKALPVDAAIYLFNKLVELKVDRMAAAVKEGK